MILHSVIGVAATVTIHTVIACVPGNVSRREERHLQAESLETLHCSAMAVFPLP